MISSYSPMFNNSSVISLTLDQMDEDGSLMNTKSMADYNLAKGKVVVLYYADWCPHCQDLKPTIVKLAEVGKKNGFQVAAIDMAQANEILISRVKKFRYKVQGYPTLIGFMNGKPYSIYQGDRTLGDLSAYAENIGSKLKK
jgi:thiol-disulfide isomerase/thioredoxin